jgi:hypothetical protein
MKPITRYTLILTALCLAVLLAVPASAAQEAKQNTAQKPIDSGLGKDLWDVYAEYRLQIFDLRIKGAGEAIGVLEDHGCSTGSLQATLDSITGEREPLSDALKGHDRKALQKVNQDLAKLWKEFREEAKESIRECSGAGVPKGTDTGVSS